MSGIGCPRCHKPLVPREAGRATADLCSGCGGLWVGMAVTLQVERAADMAAALRKLADDAASRAPLGGALGNVNLHCPVCGQLMDRLRYVNEVAYVRFASVYRQFKDKNDFVRELDQLTN